MRFGEGRTHGLGNPLGVQARIPGSGSGLRGGRLSIHRCGALRRRSSSVRSGRLRAQRLRIIVESDRPVGAGAEGSEALQAVLPAMLHGVPHLEDQAIDLARGLQVVQPPFAQQAPQYTVVAFEQFREEDAPARLLDDERPEAGG